ncbi:MAG: protein gvpI [Haloferacaceae archaeon]
MSDAEKQRQEQARQRDRVVAKALQNRDETRRNLLAQGRKLARRRAENVDDDRGRSADADRSTTVSAHSTMPSTDSNAAAAARHSHSTVPARPKGSTVPAAVRLYGLGLYRRIRPEDDETRSDADSSASDGGGDR